MAQHLVAHAVAGGRGDLAQRRVEVLAVALEAQEEGEVVDPGDVVVELVGREPEVGGELAGGVLDGVAEADGADALARATAQQSIAIGLTYCSSSASGHSSSMSRQTSSSTGIVRRPRMIPPTPSVSPIVWRRPKRLGTSKSTTVAGR